MCVSGTYGCLGVPIGVCMYLWECVCTYRCVHVPMGVCMYLWECVCTYRCVYVPMGVSGTYGSVYVPMGVCMYLWECVCTYGSVCVYTFESRQPNFESFGGNERATCCCYKFSTVLSRNDINLTLVLLARTGTNSTKQLTKANDKYYLEDQSGQIFHKTVDSV